MEVIIIIFFTIKGIPPYAYIISSSTNEAAKIAYILSLSIDEQIIERCLMEII